MSLPNAPWGPYEKRTFVVDQSNPEVTRANGSMTLVNADGTLWSPGGGDVTSDDITDATDVSKAVLIAEDEAAARTAIGLGTAATSDSTSFASSAQGEKADTALQASDLPVAAYVGDADATDAASVASGVDAIRDALIAAGLMQAA